MRYKYNVLNYDLTNGLNEEVQVPGGFIYMKDATDLAVKIAVRPDSKTNDAVYLKKQFGIVVEFKKLYITADAQAGKTVEIIITNSYDTFRIFEQAQVQDINSVAAITNPVTIVNPTIADILKIGGTAQTGWDLQKLQKNLDAEYGTLVAKSTSISGLATTIVIHTVSVGKKFLLQHYNHYHNNGTNTLSQLFIRDVADTIIYSLSDQSGFNHFISGNCNIVIPEGYDICVSSNTATGYITAFISGREF